MGENVDAVSVCCCSALCAACLLAGFHLEKRFVNKNVYIPADLIAIIRNVVLSLLLLLICWLIYYLLFLFVVMHLELN